MKLFDKMIQTYSVKGIGKLEFLKERRMAIFQLNSDGAVPKIMALNHSFDLLCNVDRLDELKMLLKKLIKCRTVPEICVYGSFIRALFRAHQVDDALKFSRGWEEEMAISSR